MWRLPLRFFSLVRGALFARKGFRFDDPARARHLQLSSRVVCQGHGLEVELDGPLPTAPVVLVANHIGYLDPCLLASLLPCAPIAKIEVSRWPLLGSAMGGLGCIFVDRGNPMSGARALLTARRRLRAGISVLAFPEGTTTDGSVVLEFRRGVFGLARRLDVMVVPAAVVPVDPEVAWVGDQTFADHYARLASRARTRVHIRLGEAIRLDPNHTAEESAELVRRRVDALRLEVVARLPKATPATSRTLHEAGVT
jgi:1-acyl-sn-glycerol-3-phosphate acyltransferase